MESNDVTATGGPNEATTLDYIKPFEIAGDVFAKPANEFYALICLCNGLHFLAHQAAAIDNAMRQRVNPHGKLNIMLAGNDPAFAGMPLALLTCAYHWYSVSACQYVRVVGAIAYKQGLTKTVPHDYVEEVIPEVRAFRDKVAAHYAWATLHSKDTEAERRASILPPLSFVNDGFCVGALKLSLKSGGKSSDSSAIAPWNMGSVHTRLSDRYWPESRSTESTTPTAESTTPPQTPPRSD